MSVKETKELVQFTVALVKAGADVLADGKVSLADVFALLEGLKLAPAALDGVANVPAEFSTLTEAEKAALLAEVAKLDLANDVLEAWAERVLNTAIVLGALVADYVKASQKP